MNGPGESLPTAEQHSAPAPSPAASTSKPQTLREFERLLRDIGYSRNEATAIARGGFKAVQADEVCDQLDELAAVIRRNAEFFKR